MNPWFFPEDKTAPVIEARRLIAGKYPGREFSALPPKAVFFCLGRGLSVLEEKFSPVLLLEELPGFISHSPVMAVPGHEDWCFLQGGYGSPQAACAVEVLTVLGVREIFLVGLCGGFGPNTCVGEILLPERILSEEGVSCHYLENPEFAQVNSPQPLKELAAYLQQASLSARLGNTVTTDAVFRQTFYKEALWRNMDCEGVDMEASAVVNVCSCLGMKSTVALMVSDRHPLREGEPPWTWGIGDFRELRDRFITACISYALGNGKRKEQGR